MTAKRRSAIVPASASKNGSPSVVVRKEVMPKPAASNAVPSISAAAAAASKSTPATLDDVLARSGARDRANVEKHLAAAETEATPDHAKLWRKLANKLASLAPLPVQTVGLQAVLFFIPDGKYRMQVFALEDKNDGVIQLYTPDVLSQATRNKLVQKVAGEEYSVNGDKTQSLSIHALDAANTPDPPSHIKNMIGWNRKAIRVTLRTADANSAQASAAEAICDLAAAKW